MPRAVRVRNAGSLHCYLRSVHFQITNIGVFGRLMTDPKCVFHRDWAETLSRWSDNIVDTQSHGLVAGETFDNAS